MKDKRRIWSGILFVALRNLISRPRRHHFFSSYNYLHGAVLAVALAIIPLVIVLVCAGGMIEGITARYLATSTYHLQARTQAVYNASALGELAAALQKNNNILSTTIELDGAALAIARNKDTGSIYTTAVMLRALEPSFFEQAEVKKYFEFIPGSTLVAKSNEIILGTTLAKKLHAQIGDIINLGSVTSDFASPQLAAYRVRGIASAGYQELDGLWAFVTLDGGVRVLDPNTSQSFIGIKVRDPFNNIDAQRKAIADKLVIPASSKQVIIRSWLSIERNLWASFATTRALLLLIMAIAVAVASMNVGATLIMLVLERKQDLAILKSIGVSSTSIALIFILSGTITGTVGAILGIGIGLILAVNINSILWLIELVINFFNHILSGNNALPIHLLNPDYYLSSIPIHIKISELLTILGLAVLLATIASFLPARHASKFSPLEIFRKV